MVAPVSAPATAGLGDRLRRLRSDAGLTQTELAGGRFSKEYVSQIERGKTRPTRETVEWLAQRLGVDPDLLQSGLSTGDRGRIEATLPRAEPLSEGHRYEESVAEVERAQAAVRARGAAELEFRALVREAGVPIPLGETDRATALLNDARALA